MSRWLLVELPGPWGRDALRSRLDRGVSARLLTAAGRAGVRVLTIRRPGRSDADGPRSWAHVDSRPGSEAIRWGSYDDPAQLLGEPLSGVAGRPDAEPVYLVCAHGRHDTCCAIRGRPIAAALTRRRPGRVWECSHVGGDRFAANVVILPEGLYYGRVTVDSAGDVVSAYEAGEVFLPLLRGRSSLAAPVQAAQHEARRRLGERAITALPPREVSPAGPGRWRVTLTHKDRDVVVVVESQSAGAQRLTCSSPVEQPVPSFRCNGEFG